MNFIPHTQEQLKAMRIKDGEHFLIQYKNKDYYNSEETIEKGKGVAVGNNGNIYFSVTDPYGMDKLVMEAKILEKIK